MLRKPDVIGALAARAAARRRVVCGVGLFAEIRARRRWPRSAPGRRDPARRARWAGDRGAHRRSRLCRPARLDRAAARMARTRRVHARLLSSRCIRRCRNSRGCTNDKQAAVVHAVATPYRDRSHFDGQDVLESGFAGPGRVQSGWLNRALEGLPKGERVMSGARGRSDHAAGAARRRADGGLGAGGVAASRRRYRDAADRSLSPSRSGAGGGADAGLQLEKTAPGDDMKPKPGTNGAAAMRLWRAAPPS